MCRYPITVKHTYKSYHKALRKWEAAGADPFRKPTVYHQVPCGKCDECIKAKRNEWQFRYEEHHRVQSYPSYFVTLTYATEPPEGYRYEDFQKYMKKLRAIQAKICRKKHIPLQKITYSVISDYGLNGTQRGHFHVLLFNYLGDKQDLADCWSRGYRNVFKEGRKSTYRPIGNVGVQVMQPGSIGYVIRHNLNKSYSAPPGKLKKRNWKSQGIAKHLISPTWKKYLEDGNPFRLKGIYAVRTPRYFAEKMDLNPYLMPMRIYKVDDLSEIENIPLYVSRYNGRVKRNLEHMFKE